MDMGELWYTDGGVPKASGVLPKEAPVEAPTTLTGTDESEVLGSWPSSIIQAKQNNMQLIYPTKISRISFIPIFGMLSGSHLKLSPWDATRWGPLPPWRATKSLKFRHMFSKYRLRIQKFILPAKTERMNGYDQVSQVDTYQRSQRTIPTRRTLGIPSSISQPTSPYQT